jgi:aryl-alcohol dehydrogenase-like predicted oxidoreductase
MQYRELGRTGWTVSTVSFGTWAIGSAWGPVKADDSIGALRRAADLGVNFFDTADVYGDGHSERLLAQLKRERPGVPIVIATKAGRRLNPHVTGGYTRANLTSFVERSLVNLETDTLDLLQLHCPPTDVYYMPEVFGILDDLVTAGKVRYYGVSVEKVEQALKAIEYPGVQSVQLIYNVFRQRPADLFFKEARRRRVGVLARLPLSSGMLTGKMRRESTFAEDDHRSFNRDGRSFDRGETFSGVDYNLALDIIEELRPLVPTGWTMAQWALRWILMDEAVTCVIPGAKRLEQVDDNCRAADLPPIPEPVMTRVRDIYDRRLRAIVHQRW